jgi:hypothetical protein
MEAEVSLPCSKETHLYQTSSAIRRRVRHRRSVTKTVTSSLEHYWILFTTYFRYSYADGKFKHIYTGLLFRTVASTRYATPWFIDIYLVHYRILILPSHLLLSFPRGLFPSDFLTKILFSILTSPMRATRPP